MKKSNLKIRVYYEDTDCGNVVYYANYLKYMERGRTEYLRERNLELETYHQQGYIFAVADVNIKYRKSAVYNDLLELETKIMDITSVTLTFETRFYNQKNELLVVGTAKMVCIDAKTGRACKGPEDMMKILREENS